MIPDSYTRDHREKDYHGITYWSQSEINHRRLNLKPDEHPKDVWNCHEFDFSNSNFEGAKFCGAVLSRANFSGSYLKGADFSRCWLHGVNFSNANLTLANFSQAIMDNVNLEGVFMHEVKFKYNTTFYNNNRMYDGEITEFLHNLKIHKQMKII